MQNIIITYLTILCISVVPDIMENRILWVEFDRSSLILSFSSVVSVFGFLGFFGITTGDALLLTRSYDSWEIFIGAFQATKIKYYFREGNTVDE